MRGQLERAIDSCEYHVHPEKLAPIAKARRAWHEHTFAWIAENSKHKELPFEVLRAADPKKFRRDRPSGAEQIKRAVKEWENDSESDPTWTAASFGCEMAGL